MNPSTACATVVVDELVRGGVSDAVLCPGSRNAPLSYALWEADRDGRLRLHVRIDERTAGFLALGLAKGSGRAVPVVTTSGTAAANLHPALLEAAHSGTPLLALTADRPPELRGTGANQTIDQVGLFGRAVRWQHDLGVPEERVGQVAYWRSTASRALAAATGDLSGDPGPVHLNMPFREPLVPTGDAWPEPLDGRDDDEGWTRTGSGFPLGSGPYVGSPRTLVVIGSSSPGLVLGASSLAVQRGWPMICEPVTGLVRGGGTTVLEATGWLQEHRPERVLVVGRPTLSRAVQSLLRQPGVAVDIVSDGPGWADPALRATTVQPASLLTGVPPDPAAIASSRSAGPGPAQGDPSFLAAWEDALERTRRAIGTVLADEPWPTGPHVAGAVVAALPPASTLVVGSSSVVRDLELVGLAALDLELAGLAALGRQDRSPIRRVVTNRGVAGIDGTVSTAVGVALGHGAPAYALLGDLTFLHDSTGLMIGPGEPRPDLTIVVVNDDGGGIFAQLEPGAPGVSGAFERVFGTPTGVDLAALCRATGTPHTRAGTPEALAAALEPGDGIRVVEVRTDRTRRRALAARVRAAVEAALDDREGSSES